MKAQILITLANFFNFLHFMKLIDQISTQFFSDYFFQLGNFDVYYSILYGYPNEINEKQSIQFLQQLSKNGFLSEINFDIEQIQFHIKNVSEHFSEIEKSELKYLKVEILERILREKKFQLEDEDSLLLFINELYKESEEYSILFEYVEFEELTENVLKEFIDTFSIENLNICIWNKICERLIPSFTKSQKVSRTYKKKYKEFKYNEDDNFNGIIQYLTNKTGGNVHENNTVEVTSNSIFNNYYPKNVVDYKTNDGFFSKDVDGTTLCFDFKENLIQITNYSIKSYDQGKNMCHPKNWVAEVSEDGNDWIEIDHHINDPTLNGKNITSTFKVEKEIDEFYRYFQIRQTGNSWDQRDNHFYFGIQSLELFGKLDESEN